jgi:hypothetical protein
MIDFARIMASAAIAVMVGVGAVHAQGGPNFPPPMPPQNVPGPQGYPAQAPAQNPVCTRLEGQLAAIDRGGFADPARADQSRRYDEAIGRQQADLDRMVAQSRRLNCEGGFFSIFTAQNPQCPQITQQIQQMRGNLDRMLSEQQRMQGGAGGQ